MRPSDHPRSRGVYAALAGDLRDGLGSSPLARGLRLGVAGVLIHIRIIPARAGFTSDACAAGAHRQDHPRSRGVYPASSGARRWARGSSPLARGLHPLYKMAHALGRIIPARAGFTASRHEP